MHLKLHFSFFACLCIFHGISSSSVVHSEEKFETEGVFRNETQVLEKFTLSSTSFSGIPENASSAFDHSADISSAHETTNASSLTESSMQTTEKAADDSKTPAPSAISPGLMKRPRRQDLPARVVKHRDESTLYDMCPPLVSTCPLCSVPHNQLSRYICHYPVVLKVLLISPSQTDSSGRVCGKLGKLTAHGKTDGKKFRSLLRFSEKDSCECQLEVSHKYYLFSQLSAFTKQGKVYGKVSMSNETLLIPADQYPEALISKELESCASEKNISKVETLQELHTEAPNEISSAPPPLIPVSDESPSQHNIAPLPDDPQRVIPRSARQPYATTIPTVYKPAPLPNYLPTPPPSIYSPSIPLPFNPYLQIPFAPIPALQPILQPLPPLTPFPPLTPLHPYPPQQQPQFPQVQPTSMQNLYIPPLVYNPSSPAVYNRISYTSPNQEHHVETYSGATYYSSSKPPFVEHSVLVRPSGSGYHTTISKTGPYVPGVNKLPEYASTQVPYAPDHAKPTEIPYGQMIPSYSSAESPVYVQATVPPYAPTPQPYSTLPPNNYQNLALQYTNSSFSSSYASTQNGVPYRQQQTSASPFVDCLTVPQTCPFCLNLEPEIFRDAYCNSTYAFLSIISLPDLSATKVESSNPYGNGLCLNLQSQLLHDISKNVGTKVLYERLSLLLSTNCVCFPQTQGPAIVFLLGFDDQRPIPPKTQLNKDHDLFLVPAPSDTTLPHCQLNYQTPAINSQPQVQYEYTSPPAIMQPSSIEPPPNPKVIRYSPYPPATHEAEKYPLLVPQPDTQYPSPYPEPAPTSVYYGVASNTNSASSPATYDETNYPNPTPSPATYDTVPYPNPAPTPATYDVNYPASVPPSTNYEEYREPQQPRANYNFENSSVPPATHETKKVPAPTPYNYNAPVPSTSYYQEEHPTPPQQQQPYGASRHPGPLTHIQAHEVLDFCPEYAEDSCPSCGERYDESFISYACSSPFAFVAEIQDTVFQQPRYTFPNISIKMTTSPSYREKTVKISVSKPPPPLCINTSFKIIKRIGVTPSSFSEGKTIPILMYSKCSCLFQSRGPQRLLLYSSHPPRHLPNGGIQLTQYLQVSVLPYGAPLPLCQSGPAPPRPIYISPPGLPQPPPQDIRRKPAYPPSPSPPVYRQQPPVTPAQLPVNKQPYYVLPPEHKPPVQTPPPPYKRTEFVPPPPVYQPTVYTPLPQYKPPLHTPLPQYKPPLHTPLPQYKPPLPTPLPQYKPPLHTPLPQYKPPLPTPPPPYKKLEYVPPVENVPPVYTTPSLYRPLTYTQPPAYKPAVHTLPPPPSYVYQQRPAEPSAYNPYDPYTFPYITTPRPKIMFDTCPKQPLSCPHQADVLPVNFREFFCMSQFAMVVAIGVDHEKHSKKREDLRNLPFLKSKGAKLESKYDARGYSYNITVTRAKTLERRANLPTYSNSAPTCYVERVLGLYDVSPPKTVYENMIDLDLLIPTSCVFTVFDLSPTYGILMSTIHPDVNKPIQLSEMFAFYPLPEGKLILPSCSLPPHVAPEFETTPFSVTKYNSPAQYDQGMEVRCTNNSCGTCSIVRPGQGYNVPCDVTSAVVVEILETSAGLNVAPTLEIQHLYSPKHITGIALHVRSNVDELQFTRPSTYDVPNPGHVSCQYAKVRVVQDLIPYSTSPTINKELTLIIPLACDCHLFRVANGYAMLVMTKFPILPQYAVPITGDISSVLCIPPGSFKISMCPSLIKANYRYNPPLTYGFSYVKTSAPYVPAPIPYVPPPPQYIPPSTSYIRTPPSYTVVPTTNAPAPMPYNPTPTPYTAAPPQQYIPTQGSYIPTSVPYAPASTQYAPAPMQNISPPIPFTSEPQPYAPTQGPHVLTPTPASETYASDSTPFVSSSYASTPLPFEASPVPYNPITPQYTPNLYDPTTPIIAFRPNENKTQHYSAASISVSPIPDYPPVCSRHEEIKVQDCPVCDEIRCIKPEVYCNSKLAIIARPNGVYNDGSAISSGSLISLYEISPNKPAQRAVSNIMYKKKKQCYCPMLEENRFVILLVEDETKLKASLQVELDDGDYVYSTFSGKITLPACTSDRPRTGNLQEEIVLPPVLDSELPQQETRQLSPCPTFDHSCPKCGPVDDDQLKNIICSSDKAILVSNENKILNASLNLSRKEQVTVTQYIASNYSIGIEIKPYMNENRCILPEQRGDCNSFVTRYYFDSSEELCYAFDYSGCNGNGNNFETFEECESTCAENDNCKAGILRIHKTVRGASMSQQQTNKFQYTLPEECECPLLTTGELGYLVFNISSNDNGDPIQLNENYNLLLLTDAQQNKEVICEDSSDESKEDGPTIPIRLPTETVLLETTLTTTEQPKKRRWFGL